MVGVPQTDNMASTNTPADKVNALLTKANHKNKTITFRVEVTKTYEQQFTYDDFVQLHELHGIEFDVTKQEEWDAKMLPLWLAFLKKHGRSITLEPVDEGEVDVEDEGLNLIECYGDVERELSALVNEQ